MADIEMLAELKIYDDEVLKFNTSDQLIKWAQEEVTFWAAFCNEKNIKSFNSGNARPFWSLVFEQVRANQVQPFNQLLSEIKGGTEYQRYLNTLKNAQVFFSKTGRGQKLLELKESDPETALMLLVIWHPKIYADSQIKTNIHQIQGDAFKALNSALMNAYIERRLFENGIKGSAKPEKKALQIVKNEANQMLADISSNIESQNKKIKSTEDYFLNASSKADGFFKAKQAFSKQLIKKQIEDLAELKKLYTEELALKIPVTYWADKAKDHRIAAYFWGVLFIITIAAIILNASDIFHQIITGLKIVDAEGKELFSFADNQFSLFFAITFPAFLAVWVLRIFSKNMLTNFNQMHDAKNRSVMTQTFLALMSENKANDNDRILILNALFQPINSGTDDGAPPHWFELMMERLKK